MCLHSNVAYKPLSFANTPHIIELTVKTVSDYSFGVELHWHTAGLNEPLRVDDRKKIKVLCLFFCHDILCVRSLLEMAMPLFRLFIFLYATLFVLQLLFLS